MHSCSSIVHRALVTYTNPTTGEIRVKIPSVTGVNTEISISRIGRQSSNGVWAVPTIGTQIVVSADDENMTNVFWLQTDITASSGSTNLDGGFPNSSYGGIDSINAGGV
jgi:phage baseplate assembly protein gpV